MADEKDIRKGVVVDFDFAAMDGATLLHDTVGRLFAENDIPFDDRAEADHLAGGNYQGGFAEYFAVVKTKKTAAKAAKDVAERFSAALSEAIPKSVTPGFKAFVRALSERGVKVVIATRADVGKVASAFEGLLGERVVLYQETSQCYGGVKWDAWRRACVQNKLSNKLAMAVTGSGHGVKSALLAGMGSVAVVWPRVAYQDFGGADETVQALDEAVAKKVIKLLKV